MNALEGRREETAFNSSLNVRRTKARSTRNDRIARANGIDSIVGLAESTFLSAKVEARADAVRTELAPTGKELCAAKPNTRHWTRERRADFACRQCDTTILEPLSEFGAPSSICLGPTPLR